MLPFNTPWNHKENIENKWVIVTMGVESLMKYIHSSPLVFGPNPPPPPFPNPPFYAHVRFWVTPFPMCDAYIKLPCQPTQNSTTT